MPQCFGILHKKKKLTQTPTQINHDDVHDWHCDWFSVPLCASISILYHLFCSSSVKSIDGWQSHLRTHLWQLQSRKSFDFTLFTLHELCASSIFLTYTFALSNDIAMLPLWNNRIDWCALFSTHKCKCKCKTIWRSIFWQTKSSRHHFLIHWYSISVGSPYLYRTLITTEPSGPTQPIRTISNQIRKSNDKRLSKI